MAAESRVSNQERYYFHNNLSILLKAVEGKTTTVDFRNESSIHGIIEQVDGYMNIVMKNCVFVDPRGSRFNYDMFFVHSRNIRYVHIPPQVIQPSGSSRRHLSSNYYVIGNVIPTSSSSSSTGGTKVGIRKKLTSRNLTSCLCFPLHSDNSSEKKFFVSKHNRYIDRKLLFNSLSSSSCLINTSRRFSHDINNDSNTKMDIKQEDKMGVFRFSDYDCVGFDLDNTLLRYNVTNMITLEYESLSKFMVEERGYDGKYLLKELRPSDYDFMQKGLILDCDRGNILKISPQGFILRASHGTRILNDEEIASLYPNGKWEVTDAFTSDLLVTWNGPLSEKMRTLTDYFDMPASLVFARIIDTLDENRKKKNTDDHITHNGLSTKYSIWSDILAGLVHMFDRQHFAKNKGRYFSTLKSNPDKFMHKSSPELVSWLKELKKTKLTYLITGSNADFANFTASHALGKNWKSLFDVIICFAKKPGFFTSSRSFLKVESDYTESSVVSGEELKRGEIYSQGNWTELKEFLAKESGNKNPTCLYIGDNLIQDIYTPKCYVDCDTIAIVEEQLSEGLHGHNLSHSDEQSLNSKIWGSYFYVKNKNGEHQASVWSHVINNYSKICIPSVDFIVNNSLDTPLKSFGTEDERKLSGYHPAKPKTIVMP